MIERIIKAVKRGNKKRSINITIGTIVGFLLSCTAVMGEDYLWIGADSNGDIKFSIDTDVDPSLTEDPYRDGKNDWNETTKTYVNNITLSGADYGLKLSGDLGKFEFRNKGNIENDDITIDFSTVSLNKLINFGYIGSSSFNGLDICESHIDELSNNGNISSKDNTIYLYDHSTIKELNNNGNINAQYGVYMTESEIDNFTNNGNMVCSYSMVLIDSTINNLKNYGSFRGYLQTDKIIDVLINAGTIFGEDYSINNDGGTINNLYNYGILMNSDSMEDTIVNTGTITLDNFGLIFKADVGKYTATEGDFKNFGKTFEAGGYTCLLYTSPSPRD